MPQPVERSDLSEAAVARPEREWVAALRRREPWAWEQLQRATLDAVFGYVLLRCPRREDAEDLTAEVFATATRGIDRFRGECEVRTWLIGIARRKLADAARTRRRRPEVLETDLPPPAVDSPPAAAEATPEERLAEQERLDTVRRYVLQLPEPQREALWLHCVDELSLAETARVLRRSENAVKGLLRRARLTLRDRLASLANTPSCPKEVPHVESTFFDPTQASCQD